ncbi:MAG TPA: hypothetical protein VFM58_17595 [Solirubrobacteraceae bacterium]|nr:hypothetical protein [Solirubrobacteraceae bacterium]
MIAVAIALSCVGCGSAVDAGESSAPPYPGRLDARAAVDALECDGRTPFFRARGDYDSGLEEVRSDPEAAFDNYLEEEAGGFYHVPGDGYRVERRDEDRALLSYDVGDRTKVAVVLADGIRDYRGEVGWGVVAWADCDPAELPAEVTDGVNVGIWEDASGRRLPVTRVHSFQGAEHCDWTDVTFLLVGPGTRTADWYVRDTKGEFADYLRGTFDGEATLPHDARSTGWRRDGRRLWLARDKTAAYLVSIGDPHDVERWPAATQPIMCA